MSQGYKVQKHISVEGDQVKPGFYQTQRTQRNRLRCVRCVNENRKKRKGLIGCFYDWLLRSTIPIGWRLRALLLNGNRALRNGFCLRNFIAFIAFFFLRKTLRAFEWKPGLSLHSIQRLVLG